MEQDETGAKVAKGLHSTSHTGASDLQSLPLYLRIRHSLRDRIAKGEYALGTAIPSEAELARFFGTTKATVRGAIDGLIDEGLVLRIQGKGTFVARGLNSSGDKLHVPRGFRDSQLLQRHVPSIRVLETSIRPVGGHYARLFGVDPGGDLYHVRRLNCIDGAPFAIESTLIPCEIFPGVEEIDISLFSLYEFYSLRGHAVVSAHEELEVCELKAREAQLLRARAHDPALGITCVSYDADGRALECARSLAVGENACYLARQ